jgi:regulator of sirC expression with transglutaminase-like and TPR domain
MKEQEIKALIRLLDDNDAEVFEQIESKLVTLGRAVIPILESAWSSSLDALMQERIENIIHKIQVDDLYKELKEWATNGGVDLMKGALLIARYQYADLNEKQILATLDKIKKDAWLEMNPNLTALEQIKILNHIFFEIHGFSGNTQNYHAPQNSFVNIAIETKKGNPLMLAILYLEVARSAEIPVYGVNLPEHFILCYKDEQSMLGLHPEAETSNILFYINPFSKGDVFNRKEVEQFLKQLNLPEQKTFFEPCTNTEMIQRLIRNLINSYHKLGFMDKVEELELLMNATEN